MCFFELNYYYFQNKICNFAVEIQNGNLKK